jgi:hypothetical protein
MWTGDDDTGGIDSAIASTAPGESHPNKPNIPLGWLERREPNQLNPLSP